MQDKFSLPKSTSHVPCPRSSACMDGGRVAKFGRILREMRLKAGKSKYSLSAFTGLDPTYLRRLETGQRLNPSFDTVIKICVALASGTSGIGLEDINDLLLAAGYAPLRTRGERGFRIGPASELG